MSSRLGFARAAHGVSALLLSLVILASTWAFFIAADQEGPAGVTEGFSIVALPPEESGAATLHSAIRGAAEREQVNIYKVTPSLEGEAVGQDYFAFTGNDDALLGDLATGSFPAFSRGFPAQLHPAEELTPEQHLGLYMIQGSPDAAESVRAALQGEGLELTPASTPPMLVLWAAHLVTGGWGTATLTLWAALLLTSANLLSVRLGIHGLRRATGSSALHATSLDAAAVLLPAALSAALPTAVLLIHSLVRADGYRAPSILVTGLSTAVLVLSASAAAIAVIMLLMLRRDVGAVLKGARPVRTLGVLSVTVLLLSTCAMGAGTIAAIHHSQEDQWAQEAHDYLTARPEVFSVLGSFALSGQQGDALNDGLGAAYRDLEPRRQATLMTSTLLEEVTATDPHRQAHRTLLTDSGFLSTLTGAPPALEDEVVRITSQEGGVAVIIPRTLEAESARITRTSSRSCPSRQGCVRTTSASMRGWSRCRPSTSEWSPSLTWSRGAQRGRSPSIRCSWSPTRPEAFSPTASTGHSACSPMRPRSTVRSRSATWSWSWREPSVSRSSRPMSRPSARPPHESARQGTSRWPSPW